MMCDVAGLKLFFSEPILGPPNVDFSRENEKMDSKKPVSTRHVATNGTKRGSITKLRLVRQLFTTANLPPRCVNNGG
jgi:hypothetical protein